MFKYRSSLITQGSHMAGARALLRATGMKDSDFNKPIIAIVNSFTQFVPGHIHLRNVGKIVAKEIENRGGIAKEFNTIAIDDGIAMGHDGMLYSLPSRELIADSVEYMINAHCVDGMVCISNCDKITPGMFIAAMRLNIPVVFVSGGPMESGRMVFSEGKNFIKLNLIDAIKSDVDPFISNEDKSNIEASACPTCGSCSGLFTANSMNCLMEALGLALPGNGSLLATHYDRKRLFQNAGKYIMSLVKNYYINCNEKTLPRNIANKASFENAMSVDIAMGGSSNTILHLLAAAKEGNIDFFLKDIDLLSRKIPFLCKISPNNSIFHMEDMHRAGGVMGILGELNKIHLINCEVYNILGLSLKETLKRYDIKCTNNYFVKKMYSAAPGKKKYNMYAFSQKNRWPELDYDRVNGCIRSYEYAYSKNGGLAVLYGNLAEYGCIIKTAGIKDLGIYIFSGPAKVYESQEDAVSAILNGLINPGDVIVIRYEGPRGGPGMQEMLYPTTFLKSMKLDQYCALITDGRFSGGTSGFSVGHISPEASNQGLIGLVKNGDIIYIDIKSRKIELMISNEEILKRKAQEMNRGLLSWTPMYKRNRKISLSLKIYARLVTGADTGATRNPLKFI